MAFVMIEKDIVKKLNEFSENKDSFGYYRNYSFDYCYNYFYSFYQNDRLSDLSNKDNLQLSCLTLGYYLASWGMLRGSSFLLQRYSVKCYDKLIDVISKAPKKLWEIDVNNYTSENIDLLLEYRYKIKEALGIENNASDILITKIMLGVFGNVPAFDKYFGDYFNIRTLNDKSLKKLKLFYESNKNTLNNIDIYTLDFNTNKNKFKYPLAKLIDMYGFQKGTEIYNKNKR